MRDVSADWIFLLLCWFLSRVCESCLSIRWGWVGGSDNFFYNQMRPLVWQVFLTIRWGWVGGWQWHNQSASSPRCHAPPIYQDFNHSHQLTIFTKSNQFCLNHAAVAAQNHTLRWLLMICFASCWTADVTQMLRRWLMFLRRMTYVTHVALSAQASRPAPPVLPNVDILTIVLQPQCSRSQRMIHF